MPARVLRRPRPIVASPAVEVPRLASLNVTSPMPIVIGVGAAQSYQITVEGLDQFGNGIAITPYHIAYESSDPSKATVSATGLIEPGASSGNPTVRAFSTIGKVEDRVETLLPVEVTTTSLPTPDAISAPSLLQAQVGGVTVTFDVIVLQGATHLLGRTLDVVNHHTSNFTLSADDNSNDPTHRFVLTPLADSSGVLTGAIDVTDHESGITTSIDVSIEVVVSGGGTPDIDETFNVADKAAFVAANQQFIANVRHGWEDVNFVPAVSGNHPNQIDIDPAKSSPGAPAGSKSMVYHYPDRTGEGAPVWNGTGYSGKGFCGDYTISRNYRFKNPVIECWEEIEVELSAGFTVICPGCGPGAGGPGTPAPSSAGMKFFFPCLLTNPNLQRHGSYIDDGAMHFEFPSNAMASGTYVPVQNSLPFGGPALATLVAAAGGFTVRYHNRISQSFAYPATTYETDTCRGSAGAGTVQLAAGGGGGAQVGHYVTVTSASGQVSTAVIATVSGLGGATPNITVKNPTSLGFTPTATTTYRLSTTPCTGDGIAGMEVFIGGVSKGRHVFTGLVTGTVDAGGRIFITGPGQRSPGPSFDRNMNQGPLHVQDLWYKRFKAWLETNDPGWGW